VGSVEWATALGEVDRRRERRAGGKECEWGQRADTGIGKGKRRR
jgi:hypothetical protein